MDNDTKIIIGLVVLSVAVVGALLWLGGRSADSGTGRYLPTAVTQAVNGRDDKYPVGELVNESDYQDGSADAPVTLVELADFECPICRTVYPVVNQLREDFAPDQLRLAYRHVPLWEIHSEALPSARAAQAAHRQDKFKEYATALYENQSRLGEELYVELAEKIGLNLEQFNQDRSSDEVAWLAARARNYAESQGWEMATPTLVINGQLYQGARTREALKAAVTAAGARPLE